MDEVDWDNDGYTPSVYTENTDSDRDVHQSSSFRSKRNDYSDRDEQGDSETIEIPADKVGAVIGRAGARIKEIESTNRVKLHINKNDIRNGQIEVEIRGSPHNIESAKAAIEEAISFNSSDRNDSRRSFNRDHSSSSRYESRSHSSKYDKPYVNSSAADSFVPIDWNAVERMDQVASVERWGHLPALVKDIYQESKHIAAMSSDRVARFRLKNNNIMVSRPFATDPGVIPNPIATFEDCFYAYPDLLAELNKSGFKTPSPIQCQSWPILLKGQDMIGIAQTGTGKTLAFLLPALLHIELQPTPRHRRTSPSVLVLAPTRELALQIEKEVAKYNFRNIRAVCLYGGANRQEQIQSYQKGVEIVIATPGRLNDLIAQKILNVENISYLVLDEADRMLDMGFDPQIRKVILDIRPDHQTVMTSATWPTGVRELAKKYMDNPIQVFVGSLDLAAVHSVTQLIEIITEDYKYNRLLDFIRDMRENDKVIIFCGRKQTADDLSCDLSLSHINCQVIHGNREQQDREQALDDIKTGYTKILIATDVASRGLDIEDLTHVVNYDFPRNIEEYVHRVGRTGRAGRTGTSLSFFTRSNWGSAAELIPILKEANQEVPDELYNMAERFKIMKQKQSLNGGGGRGHGRHDSRFHPF